MLTSRTATLNANSGDIIYFIYLELVSILYGEMKFEISTQKELIFNFYVDNFIKLRS